MSKKIRDHAATLVYSKFHYGFDGNPANKSTAINKYIADLAYTDKLESQFLADNLNQFSQEIELALALEEIGSPGEALEYDTDIERQFTRLFHRFFSHDSILKSPIELTELRRVMSDYAERYELIYGESIKKRFDREVGWLVSHKNSVVRQQMIEALAPPPTYSKRTIVTGAFRKMAFVTAMLLTAVISQLMQYHSSLEDVRLTIIEDYKRHNPSQTDLVKRFETVCLNPDPTKITATPNDSNLLPIGLYQCGSELGIEELLDELKKAKNSLPSVSFPLSVIVKQ
ncbi:hypothetical protein VIBNISOn1_1050034 [Vibrio nigripulchritudo SOn1]|uniref:Uncharacterized protein n=1 Tax=Vibrio nigripulchritudo SOn1 TaxID=1238450 RepID=A0AAV2VI64_9VIBR|nr:hypothetical protein [Vibrio nigripulchritudo]CCO44208.1 hypothetical protein VIBNISOn1_1050034 [Vibrio nigripulchritudo SOn1]